MLESKMKWTFANSQSNSANWGSNRFSPLIKELLLQRGITSLDEAEAFVSPDLAQLYNGQLLSNSDKAAERVHEGIANGDKILVYGDYDADGVSSTAIMIKTLQELGAECDYYIPNRFTEGYGPNEEAFRAASEKGYRLIITVDTGIAAIPEAVVAKDLGIDLIITDHHEPQEPLPDALAIIHPKCSPDYGFKELAGAGVALKFAEVLLGYFPKHLLDFAAIGTIADLVPLTGENRVIAYYGLKALSASSKPGLHALKQVCGINGDVTEEDIGFSIGPRLNAVGRLQDADLAVHLLLTDIQEEADEIAETVQSINQERQQIVSTIVKEAEEMTEPLDDQGVIVVAKEGWHQGVLGIVASNLVRKYDRPAIVLSILPETGTVKGSARSIPAFDLFTNCMKIRDVFTHFGGHAQAAGMTLPLSNLQTLKTELNDRIHQELTTEDFTQEIEVAGTIGLPEMNEELVEEIRQLAPFGMANPKPVFHVKEVPANIRQIGKNKKHLKMQFRHQGQTLDGIGFGLGNLYNHLTPKTPISIVGELGINEWNGFRKVQLIMQDMTIGENQLFDHRGKNDFDITPYVQQHRDYTAVYHSLPDETNQPDHVRCVTYDTEVSSLGAVDTVFLFDMPTDLKAFKRLLLQLNPANIHACFQIRDSAFMTVFPARGDFKWLYALLFKRKQIDINQELPLIMDAKAWTKDHIEFITNVFFDLGFVKIENGFIKLNPNPVQKDLAESAIYQDRLTKAEIEKALYYSTYDELKTWLSQYMEDRGTLKEELVYGL
ncbi:single-stranded-DNA-specific exonuclease RecJ [Lentibacillus salicampi]|uniref:Single-stranded-DNA-specific exonuclease RecJ n=1 Tax=Lentibacillus salicampi TaxID=175306 RepID=A0A4Y9AF15_9BACI|nr:single-stranded-DNA-specific exonuclease RecJ [Lentibacillus salicampi]TFJ94015.1 single-stranded-DNA-specific exonuclease RecJ [Lentibacillus salicampi]